MKKKKNKNIWNLILAIIFGIFSFGLRHTAGVVLDNFEKNYGTGVVIGTLETFYLFFGVMGFVLLFIYIRDLERWEKTKA